MIAEMIRQKAIKLVMDKAADLADPKQVKAMVRKLYSTENMAYMAEWAVLRADRAVRNWADFPSQAGALSISFIDDEARLLVEGFLRDEDEIVD